MKQCSEHLYWIDDTCSAYLMTDGEAGLLIDCGTDFSPEALRGSPAARVEQLLLTHFHRDQCAGAAVWQQQATKVGIPFCEKRYFEETDLLRASYDIFDNYTSFYPCFGPLTDLTGDFYVRDYEAIEWRGIRFDCVPLPGHTFGSVGYRFELDGKRFLACGDLLSAPGKIHEYYSTQWRYMDFQGHVNQLESLRWVESLEADWLLPGHGEPFRVTPEAIRSLREDFERLYELFHGRAYEYYQPRFRKVTEHVHEIANTEARTYIVQDDQGHGLLIDCGYASNAPINANPHRFIDNVTPYLDPELGITSVEWFLPTHYHDDHLAGYPALKNRYGTRVAASRELADILERPENYDMPCLLPEGVSVDRTVERGEAFEWRGMRFYIEQHPGQTLYHQLIWFEADGKKFLSIGDNVSGLSFREQRDYIHSFIPKNRTPVSSYRDMSRQILDHAPDTVLTGHGGAVPFERDKVERWRDWMDEWQGRFERILDQPHPNLGMDPQWIEFYPYKFRVRRGEVRRLKLRVTNHETETRACTVSFRSVAGVKIEPDGVELQAGARAVTECELTVTFPGAFTTHSIAVVADVTWNGRRLGEIAEAIALPIR